MPKPPVSPPRRLAVHAGWLAGACLLACAGSVLAAPPGRDCADDGMFSRLFRQVGELVGAPGRAEALPAIPLARNSTETVLEDMGRRNDARIPGYEKHTSGWYVGPGHTLLGNDPRLRNGGDWFRDSYGDRFDLDRRLTAAMPWIVLAEGDSNKAVNAKVQLANVRFFFLRGS